jgi:hypothetical protein
MSAPSRLVMATLCALMGALAFASGPAQAGLTHPYTGVSFGPGGPGVGVFGNPQGVAIDAAGDVYVYDTSGGGSIYKFDSAGKPVNFSALGSNVIAGVGGAGGAENEIAVSPAGATAGDIYVAHFAGSVAIYAPDGTVLGELNGGGPGWGDSCGVATDSAGHLYVSLASGYVNRYAPSGSPVTNADYTSSLYGIPTEPCNIAVDSAESVYEVKWSSGPVTKYEASQFNTTGQAAVGTLFDSKGSTLAVDPIGKDLYVDEQNQIAEYDLAASPPSLLGSSGGSEPGALASSFGVAINSASGDLYAADGNGTVEIFGPAVALFEAVTRPASGVSDTAATLNGAVDPGEVEVSSCQFEYGTEEGVYTKTVPCSSEPGSGNAFVPVSAEVSGLSGESGTTYYYRVVATNENSTSEGLPESFTTPYPPAITEESAKAITKTTATVTATINPGGASTTCKVEYGVITVSEHETACPGLAEPAAFTGQPVIVGLTRLIAGDVYHYRFVAGNVVNPSVPGAEEQFETTDAPTVIAEAARNVQRHSASLHAELNPHNFETNYHFEYGSASVEEHTTPSVRVPAGTAEGKNLAPETAGELAPATTYQYRLVATNPIGATYGPIETFTTEPPQPPMVLSESSEQISQTTTTITAVVDPNGLQSSYALEIGTEVAPGVIAYTPRHGAIGAEQRGLTFPLMGLLPGATYHYRIVLTNEDGASTGADETFTTQGFPSTISQPPTPLLAAAVAFPETETTTTKPRSKPLANTQKLKNALKACRKDQAKNRRRASCERHARKKYHSRR